MTDDGKKLYTKAFLMQLDMAQKALEEAHRLITLRATEDNELDRRALVIAMNVVLCLADEAKR
jgi:hypothetical protein